MNAAPSKQQMIEEGIQACKMFLIVNGISPVHAFKIGPVPHAMNAWQATGLYFNGTIYCDPAKTTTPRLTRGRVWTWPRYKVDKSPVGVLAHETGHHVFARTINGGTLEENTQAYLDWMQVCEEEKAMSGYEPVYEESFAEAMRLFILNPNLLEEGRPMRYWFFRMVLNLKPTINALWEEVLRDAPQHILDAADKWTGGGRII